MDLLVHELAHRGEELMKKIKDIHILMCGCGMIGSNTINNMTRQGFGNISVIDNDRIEEHNIGTQTWGKREINGKKVDVMRNQVHMATGIRIFPIDKKLTNENIGKIFSKYKNTIVIDGFDNFESRGVIKDYCDKNKVDCLHIGLSEFYAEIVWNERYKIPTRKNKGADVCEYPLSRNIGMLANIIGIESIIKYLSSGEKKSYSITLGDLKITELE